MGRPYGSNQILARVFDEATNSLKTTEQISPAVPVAGRTSVALARHDYTAGTVTTAAYTEIVSALSDQVNELYIFDSSGRTLFLAVGAAGVEVDQMYIVPGGNGRMPLKIASGARVSVKAIGTNATKGELSITFLK